MRFFLRLDYGTLLGVFQHSASFRSLLVDSSVGVLQLLGIVQSAAVSCFSGVHDREQEFILNFGLFNLLNRGRHAGDLTLASVHTLKRRCGREDGGGDVEERMDGTNL